MQQIDAAGVITWISLIYANAPKCQICYGQQATRNTHDKNRSMHIWIKRGLIEMRVWNISQTAEVFHKH